MCSPSNKTELFVSVHRALYEAIPANLRGLICRYSNGTLLWRAYFNNEFTEEEKDVLSESCTEIVSDFPDFIENVKEEYLVRLYPLIMESAPIDEWGFKRFEHNEI